MIEISGIKLPAGTDRQRLFEKVQKKTGRAGEYRTEILRHAVDARKRPLIYDVYTVGLSFAGKDAEEREAALVRRLKDPNVKISERVTYRLPEVGADKNAKRPVVVGLGPAGLLAAYALAHAGLKPLILERGKCAEERREDVKRFFDTGVLDPSSNVQFGEAGAGTFSDGKLTTGVKDREGRIRFIFELFVRHGAPREILYEALPHIGTDRLAPMVTSIRKEIEQMGGEVRFSTVMTGLVTENGRVTGVRASHDGREETIDADKVILAAGHSARDTFRMLRGLGVPMRAKAFAVGFRISHPQSMVDGYAYGDLTAEEKKKLGLPPASYKLTGKAKSGRGIYSFCMCPGGTVVNASSEEGRLCVNGMSNFDRGRMRANAAIVGQVGAGEFDMDDPLAGVRFQEMLEEKAFAMAKGAVPVEKVTDHIAAFRGEEISGESSDAGNAGADGRRDVPEKAQGRNEEQYDQERLSVEEEEKLCLAGRGAFAPLHTLLPENLSKDIAEGIVAFDRKWNGFAGDEAYLLGLESRTSSPVRIERGESLESPLKGLYPGGEGAGFAGGIVSAAVDGLKLAEAVIRSL